MSHRAFQISDEERVARSQRVHIATEANKRASAIRALDDPLKVGRAVRITKEAIARDVVGVEAFVADVRASRIAAGKPEFLADADMYRLLDGLLADRSGGAADA